MPSRNIPIHELPESLHPIDLGASNLGDDTLDRYEEAVFTPLKERNAGHWAVIVAVQEAAPHLDPYALTNYYTGQDDIAQLRSPVQGGSVNQS